VISRDDHPEAGGYCKSQVGETVMGTDHGVSTGAL